jgi:hypothetical protein
MFTQIIDALATRAEEVLSPKTSYRLARPISAKQSEYPVLEVYPAAPTQVSVVATDGTAQMTDEIRVGYYTTDPDSMVTGSRDWAAIAESNAKIDALTPKLLTLAQGANELPGVYCRVESISRASKSGHYGIEVIISADYLISPEVTP